MLYLRRTLPSTTVTTVLKVALMTEPIPVAPELKSFIAWNGLDLRIKSVHKK